MPFPVNQGMVNKIAGDDLWEQENISYSINLQEAGHQTDAAEDKFGSPPDFVSISSDDRAAIQEAVELWDDLIDNSITENDVDAAVISVNEVTNIPSYSGGITFGTLHETISGPDNEGVYLKANITVGSFNFTSAIHEFGHALGLSHPGDYNADVNQPTYQNDRMFDEDTMLFSIMSYFDPSNYISTINWSPGDIRTPMIYDIVAVQQLYGADTTTRSGDTTYGFNTRSSDFRNPLDQSVYTFIQTANVASPTDPTSFHYVINPAVFTIWDTGGDHDRIDASGFTTAQRIDLNPGTYSDIGETTAPDDPANPNSTVHLVTLVDSIGIAYGVTIEEAIGGSGKDTITGNGADNHLSGGDGDDQLSGDSGNDILDGGAGRDVLHGDLGDDALTGGDGDDFLFGDFGGDTLDGGAGVDYIDGGGALDGAGSAAIPDTLTGGADADTFIYSTHYRTTVITDYDATEDTIDFTNLKWARSFVDVLGHATQQGADVLINFADDPTVGGVSDTLRLNNTTLADLDPSSMRFSEETENPVPPEYRLITNSYSPYSNPFFPGIAPLADGGFVTAETTGVVHRFDAHGVETGTFAANTTPLVAGISARLVPLVGGGFAVAWDFYGDPSSNTPSIRARVFDADGNPRGDDFQVAGPSTNSHIDYIAATPSGGVIVDEYVPVPTTYGHHFRYAFDINGAVTGGDDLGPDHEERTTPEGSVYYVATYDPDGRLEYPVGLNNGNSTVQYEGDGQYHLSNGDILHVFYISTDTGGYYGQTTYELFAEIEGKTRAAQLDTTSEAYLPFGGYQPASVAELADGRIAITWATGSTNRLPGGAYTSIYTAGMDAVIFDDHTLTGFTKPGTSGDDVLRGGPGNDQLYGGGGNDTLIGGLGGDILDGGNGIDAADYSRSLEGVDLDLTRVGAQVGGHADGDILVSIENITGSAYHDNLTGDAGDNVINGGYGGDYIFGGGGADQLHGQAGDDHVTLQGDNGTAWGEAGDDTLTVTGNGNTLNGGAGGDTYFINGDNNYVDDDGSDESQDTFYVTGNNNQVHGEGGPNVFHVLGHASGNTLYGGPGDDILRNLGDGDNNTFYGGEGADNITGGVGIDLIIADQSYPVSAGDVVHADAGDDQVWSKGNQDVLDGGTGTDSLYLDLNWVPGNILVTFDEPSQTFTANEGTEIVGFEHIEINLGYGTNTVQAAGFTGSLVLWGNSGGSIDIFEAGSGDDKLYGGGFADILKGGDGDDYFEETGVHTNLIEGGAGHNSLSYEYVFGGIYADLANERVYSKENGGGFDSDADLADATTFDTVRGIETIHGSYYNDQFRGSTADETFLPGHGNDVVVGGGGRDTVDYSNADYAVVASLATGIVTEFAADTEIGRRSDTVLSTDHVAGISNLTGSSSDDDLIGDDADNVITGGQHDDLLTGNGGADVFVYRDNDGTDTITDFAPGVDRIDLTGVAGHYALSDVDISQDGANTIISFAPIQNAGFASFAATEFYGDGVVLENVQMGDLTERDFIFASPPEENLPPVAAAANAVVTNEDTTSAPVAIGASDPDGDTLSYAVKSGFEPALGTVAFVNGDFTYTPNANANGSDIFTIVIDDDHGGTVEQVVSVTVNPVNDAPIAAATNAVVTNEATTSAPVAIGASDPDGDVLSYAIKSGFEPALGTVAFANGDFTYTPSADANGSDSFTIVIDDGDGGIVEQMVSVTINPDTLVALPSVALATDSGLAGDGITNAGTVNVAGLETGATWEYAVNGGAFVAGTGTSFSLSGDGSKSVRVHQTDAAGNTSGDASLSFTLDTASAAPSVVLATDSGMAGDGITNAGTVNVAGLEAGANWEYAVNGGAFVAGTGTSFSLSGDGPKSMLVHQTDAAGNVSADAMLAFTLDTSAIAPAVALATDSGIAGDGVTNTGTINVSGLEAGASWEYAIDGGAFVVGSGSSFTLTGDGPKSVLVHQADIAGNLSADASLSFTLDTAAAALSVALATDSATAGDGVTNMGTVNVAGLETGASWEYAVNGGAFVAGTGTSFTLTGDGPKTVLVHQTDAAGNMSGDSSLTFTLDTASAAPSVALATDGGIDGDGITNAGTVNVSGLEAGATWEYAVNGGAFVAGTGTSLTLSGDGPKTVLVHQTDAAGNMSGDTVLVFALDTMTSDAITTTSGTVTDPAQIIRGSGEAGAKIQLLDGTDPLGAAVTVDATGQWSSATTLTGTGDHIITAVATDVAGNTATSNAITLTLSNDDIVINEPGRFVLNGTSGDDHIVINQNNLLIDAGNGDDILSLVPVPFAVHLLTGGNGTDTLDFSAMTGANSIDLSTGLATGSQSGLILFSSVEDVTGGAGSDTIIGNSAANRLDGGGGRDTIRAGSGNDTIVGGAGNDSLTGGGGSDTFIFRPNFGKDVITDFQVGTTAASTHDVLDLHGLGFTSIQDVLDHTGLGSNAVIHAGLDDITLFGVTKGQLTEHPFDLSI